jgi:hypothetical protein
MQINAPVKKICRASTVYCNAVITMTYLSYERTSYFRPPVKLKLSETLHN